MKKKVYFVLIIIFLFLLIKISYAAIKICDPNKEICNERVFDGFCGDNTCNSNENCSTCSTDCGACQDPPGQNCFAKEVFDSCVYNSETNTYEGCNYHTEYFCCDEPLIPSCSWTITKTLCGNLECDNNNYDCSCVLPDSCSGCDSILYNGKTYYCRENKWVLASDLPCDSSHLCNTTWCDGTSYSDANSKWKCVYTDHYWWDDQTDTYTPSESGNCNNGNDDDCDALVDEEDADCSFSFSVSPNPADYSDELKAIISSDVYGTTNICDYRGCNNGGCFGTFYCSISNGATSCSIGPAPNPGYDSTKTYSYYACNGENSFKDVISVKGSYCGDGSCDIDFNEDCSSCSADCGSCPAVKEDCSNNIDDDNDGFVDEEDSDCSITLSLSPNPALANGLVTATVSADDNSLNLNGALVNIGLNDCNNIVCSFSSGSSCSFNAPSTIDNHIFYACINNIRRANKILTVCDANTGSSCDDGNICTINDKVLCDGSCVGNLKSGSHNECSNGNCISVSNTIDSCVDTCSSDSDCSISYCGNGVVDSGEQCDGSDLNGNDCVSLGFDAGSLSCNSDCTFDTSGCYNNCVCGNNICEDACETPSSCSQDCNICSSFNSEKCYTGPAGTLNIGICKSGTRFCNPSFGWGSCIGEVTPKNEICNNNLDDDCDGYVDCEDSDCKGLSGCPITFCGDGVVDSGEQCDGSDLNGKSCVSLGFDAGSLSCNSDCTFDTSGCYYNEVCNNGIDDDNDGLVDCEDSDCYSDSSCLSNVVVNSFIDDSLLSDSVSLFVFSSNNLNNPVYYNNNYNGASFVLSPGSYFFKVLYNDYSGFLLKDIVPGNNLVSVSLVESSCSNNCLGSDGFCDYSCLGSDSCVLDSSLSGFFDEVIDRCSGKKPGDIVSLSDGSSVVCCGAEGVFPETRFIPGSSPLVIDSSASNNYEVIRVVNYRGRLLKLKIDVYK